MNEWGGDRASDDPVTYRRDDAPATLKPVPKVVAGGAAGAVAVIIVWAAGLFGLDVPDYVAAAFALLVSVAASYLRRSA